MTGGSPSLRAVPFRHAVSEPIELLSNAQRMELARYATVRTLAARTVVYRSGADATSVFIVADGVLKSFRELPSGRRRIALFLFPRDIFGLAEAGRYVNWVQAITPVRLYELTLADLTDMFTRDGKLELQFLCKVVHILREAQHHNIIVARRDAAGRVAMLLSMLLRQTNGAQAGQDVWIPMTRSDIANYLGLSLEAVVRACRRLDMQGIVNFVGRHNARIVDQRRFASLVSDI